MVAEAQQAALVLRAVAMQGLGDPRFQGRRFILHAAAFVTFSTVLVFILCYHL
jgi:hypothetical protein